MRTMTLPEHDQKNEIRRQAVEGNAIPENELGEPKEVLSPSGRFRLTITNYKSGWLSRGVVTRVEDGVELANIIRNYSFKYSWVIKGGSEYLITGRSYMSQTIVNLETGAILEPKGNQYDGHTFCWALASLSPDSNTLVVDGCHWACPYEFRFFDFTDPEGKGWPGIPVLSEEAWGKHQADGSQIKSDFTIDSDQRQPEFHEDGSVTIYRTEQVFSSTGQTEWEIELEDWKDEHEDESLWEPRLLKSWKLSREEGCFVVRETWTSEVQAQRERRNKEAREAQDQQFADWRQNDAFLKVVLEELREDADLDAGGQGWMGTSVVNRRDQGELNHWYFNLEVLCVGFKPEGPKKNATLRWGTIAGETLILDLWTYGIGSRETVFPKTPVGLKEALDRARTHFRQGELSQ